MDVLHFLSILIEALVAILGLLFVFEKKKNFGWGIFLTFAIYVFYDLSNLLMFDVGKDILYLSFFIATLSIFWALYLIYKKTK